MKGNCPALPDYYFLTTSNWLFCLLESEHHNLAIHRQSHNKPLNCLQSKESNIFMTQLTCHRSLEDRLHAPAGWLLCHKMWCDERTSCFVARWSGGWDWFAKWTLWSDRFLMDGSHCCPGGFVRWRVVEWCIALRCRSWVSGWIVRHWKWWRAWPRWEACFSRNEV
jgi:hypothetical protein